MQKCKFIATHIIHEENENHVLVGTGPNGEQYFAFELSREVANEIAEKLDLQIINVKKQKSWQDDQENAEAVNAVALQ